MKKFDWESLLLIGTCPECSPVGASYEELYQQFKARLMTEIGICTPLSGNRGVIQRLEEVPPKLEEK